MAPFTFSTPKSADVFDVSGAGDTVITTVAAALAIGMSVTDAARLANTAAGIVVGKVGTAGVRASLGAALNGRTCTLQKSSCRARTHIVARWRRMGSE